MDAVSHLREPTTASVPLLDAEQTAEGDGNAVDAGESWAGLMERAAGHLARGIVDLAGYGYGLRVTFVVGKGNNGGDGWAAARRLQQLGGQPTVVAVPGLEVEMSEEAEANRRRYLEAGGRATGPDGLEEQLSGCDVAVDCLLGTGAAGAPRGEIGDAVGAMIGERRPEVVVACDIPTGVQADDGGVPGEAVEADLTVTFGGLKRGLVLHPGAAHAGRVVVGDLGDRYAPPAAAWSALTAAGAAPPPLAPDADKRARGVVLVVGGSLGMVGAAILVARGALAAGAGLVTMAVPEPVQHVAAGAIPAAMTLGLPADRDGVVVPEATHVVLEHAEQSDVVAAGPGMRPSEGTRAVTDTLLEADCRVVLDADGINVYRDEGDALRDHHGALVLTPHRRELARITGLDSGDAAWEARVGTAPQLARDIDAVVVAKGPGTVTAAPDGRVWVAPTGSPALGAGGTGDVLAGVVAAAIASDGDPARAVARACWWHGLAGQLAGVNAADRSGSGDAADAIPHALALAQQLADHEPAWPFSTPGWWSGRLPIAPDARIRHDIGRIEHDRPRTRTGARP
jgi:ADP-dependent NAD(P)H-hydrate dehydratase / NAD(P)H-hydrate epimerase